MLTTIQKMGNKLMLQNFPSQFSLVNSVVWIADALVEIICLYIPSHPATEGIILPPAWGWDVVAIEN